MLKTSHIQSFVSQNPANRLRNDELCPTSGMSYRQAGNWKVEFEKDRWLRYAQICT